jgi:hypothetical protein
VWDHKFADGRVCHVVEKLSELPPPSTFPKRVCFDVETTSFDDAAPAFEAWKGHRIAGYGLAVSPEEAWYIPVRHHEGRPMLRPASGVGHFGDPVMSSNGFPPNVLSFRACSPVREKASSWSAVRMTGCLTDSPKI